MSWRRWEQSGIELEGEKKRAEEAATYSDLDSSVDESSGASGLSGAEYSGSEV